MNSETKNAETKSAEIRDTETGNAEADNAEAMKAEAMKAEAMKAETEQSDCANDSTEVCECCRRKKRSQQEFRILVNRLSRIEGQIRGIKNMVENDAYCIDILVQVAAASSALSSFSKILLTEHIKTCVADDLRNGRYETLDELTDVLQRLMR